MDALEQLRISLDFQDKFELCFDRRQSFRWRWSGLEP